MSKINRIRVEKGTSFEVNISWFSWCSYDIREIITRIVNAAENLESLRVADACRKKNIVRERL